MPKWLGGIAIASGPVPVVVLLIAVVAVVLAIGLPLRAPSGASAATRADRARLRWIALVLAAAGAGAAFGLALTWLLADHYDLFEIDLSPVSRGWIAGAFAALGAMVPPLLRGRALRRALASIGVVFALIAGVIGVNADFGQYTTLGSLGGEAAAGRLSSELLAKEAALAPGGDAPIAGTATRQPAGAGGSLSDHGVIGTVTIPAPLSRFTARPAYVYLPPRALVAHPALLPVLVLLAGQPGGPDVMVRAGRVAQLADDFARAHNGLAPIIVIPDQLSAPQVNPMCVDSPIGNSATYITRDVTSWILHHLGVEPQVGAWSIGGFSQGGTCTIQFGAAHPHLYSGLLDISGQVAPFSGSVANTIATGFGGSQAAYEAALPESLLKKNTPYRSTAAVFTSGALDAKYGPGVTTIADAARAAGMSVSRLVSPGTAHDWGTVRWSLQHGLPILCRHLGIGRA